MGLFSFGKKHKEDGFEFIIEETFALKDKAGAVASGRLKRGRFSPGVMAVCLNEEGTPVLRCRIEGIEQGTKLMKIATSDNKGTYGNHYGLKLGNVTKEQIPVDGSLVPETEELLDRLMEYKKQQEAQAEEEVSMAQAAQAEGNTGEKKPEEQAQEGAEKSEQESAEKQTAQKSRAASAGPLGRERERELAGILFRKEITGPMLDPLTIPEAIFLLGTLKHFHSQSPIADYEKKGKTLYEAILGKLKKAPSLYVLIDEATNLPFVIGNTAEVYSGRELAEKSMEFYKTQFHKLHVQEIKRGDSGLPGGLGLFSWMYYLGMERILVDNGGYKFLVDREALSPAPDFEKYKGPTVPVANPSLRFAVATFLEEARWLVTYPEREENLKVKKEAMIGELLKCRLLVPMKYQGGKLAQGENVIRLNQGGTMSFPKIETKGKKLFLPMFTDWPEFQKAYRKEEWSCMVFGLKEGMRIAGEDGIVINPLTENLVLHKEALDEIKKIQNVK
ncbi:MAG: SseB family protein [Enterocloster sp.]